MLVWRQILHEMYGHAWCCECHHINAATAASETLLKCLSWLFACDTRLATWWLLLHVYEPTRFLSFMLTVRILKTFTGEQTHACAYISALHHFETWNSYLCLCLSTLLAASTARRDVLLWSSCLNVIMVLLFSKPLSWDVTLQVVFCILLRISKWRPRTNQHNLGTLTLMFIHVYAIFLHLPRFQHNWAWFWVPKHASCQGRQAKSTFWTRQASWRGTWLGLGIWSDRSSPAMSLNHE